MLRIFIHWFYLRDRYIHTLANALIKNTHRPIVGVRSLPLPHSLLLFNTASEGIFNVAPPRRRPSWSLLHEQTLQTRRRKGNNPFPLPTHVFSRTRSYLLSFLKYFLRSRLDLARCPCALQDRGQSNTPPTSRSEGHSIELNSTMAQVRLSSYQKCLGDIISLISLH